jgi:hypothetical protein
MMYSETSNKTSNKPDAVNPAMALWLAIEHQWLRVTDLERWASLRATMKHIILWSMLAVIVSGCGRSSSEPTTEKLVGVWQMEKITKSDPEFTAEQHLKKDGTFEMRGTVAVTPKPITFVVHGTWRADPNHLYQTGTNSEPNLGFPLNKEEVHTLIWVGASKFSMRTPEGEERTFRRKK